MAAFLLVLAMAASGMAFDVEILPSTLEGGRSGEVVAGQAFVRLSTGTPERAGAAAALSARGAADLGEVGETGWRLVRLPVGMKVSDALQWLAGLHGISGVAPNGVLRPARTPNDPLVPSQYALSKVSAFGAWEFETGGTSKVTIVVVDAGIDGNHPELLGKLVGTSQYCNPSGAACVANEPPTPACNHATRVAGVAAAISDNAVGMAGLSWGARLLSIKVFPPAPACDLTEGGCQLGGCVSTDAALINAINYARGLHNTAAIGKVILNLSLGSAADVCPGPIQTAIDNAIATGVLIVASSGNGDCSRGVMMPAKCAGVIPVAATDSADNVASFACTGPELDSSGLYAPGVGILSTSVNGTYATSLNGTSFSAPMVSGVASLVWSARPDFSWDQVKQTVRNSADHTTVSSLDSGGRTTALFSGAGRLNALRAVRLAVRGTLDDFDGDKKAIAFPNPFRPGKDGTVSLTISLEVQGAGARFKIYAPSGRLVRELTTAVWDGRNAAGQLVASGAYFFVVTTEKGSASGRLTLVR